MTLLLFFTRRVSLELWLKIGLFDREKLIYEEHLKQGNLDKVYWVTYGHNDDTLSNQLKLSKNLHPNIIVIGMPRFFNIPIIGSYLYSLLIPLLYPKIFQESDVLKTNQMDGSWSGVVAKILYKKPLLVRTGYSISQLFRNKQLGGFKYKWFSLVEKIAYSYCDSAIVSSYHNCEYIKSKYHLQEEKISVLYNYIDLEVFNSSCATGKYRDRLLYVGRLNPEKNLFSLIEAIEYTNLTLDIYGQGELELELRDFVEKHGAKVNFRGVISNTDLARVYSQYDYYVLPSYHEGMPKTLLEAMSSGCLCIGTDVPGINEIISNGVNGILAKTTDSQDISRALKIAINTNKKEILINNGVAMIKEKCALGVITQKEFAILRNLVDAK